MNAVDSLKSCNDTKIIVVESNAESALSATR